MSMPIQEFEAYTIRKEAVEYTLALYGVYVDPVNHHIVSSPGSTELANCLIEDSKRIEKYLTAGE